MNGAMKLTVEHMKSLDQTGLRVSLQQLAGIVERISNMKDPKKETIALLARAIGDGNIPVHFKHKRTHYKHEECIVQYTFAINGVDFKTGWHDQVDCDFLEGVNYALVSTHDINLALWYVSQGDTVYFDSEQQRRDAPSDIDKALNALLGPPPF